VASLCKDDDQSVVVYLLICSSTSRSLQ